MITNDRLITAMITPFQKNGDVDYDAAKRLAIALSKSGSDGILIGGTTGESPTLSDEEKLKLFKEVKESVGDNARVIAGTTDNNNSKSIELSIEAQKLGVDALLLTVPAYNKPTQQGLIDHFNKIADSVDIPGILYNVPGRTSLNMTAETTLILSSHENIVGIKEASSDLGQITRIISESSDTDFRVWSGNDDETFSIMALGGFGIVSVASNIVGVQIKRMMGSILEGNIESAADQHKELLPLFQGLFWVTNPILIKRALNISGFNVGGLRLPMKDSGELEEDFSKMISRYDIDVTKT
ncbi:MAG: 4-hydroxy-tetrahydrodipicolinate synthase [Chloroflexota bacterium]|nr:4-hydroxy-tetrahydrodipicolinate synthase [Chloroflexota bacterium]MQG04243.1 4-hydroxy-tetrahydrodipicolinate synthase [SAR202 cluster bacterium]|tara:strand:- start:2283 stop:3176 length:894 start_codon:yes stop_codon:yes gene_type:complete